MTVIKTIRHMVQRVINFSRALRGTRHIKNTGALLRQAAEAGRSMEAQDWPEAVLRWQKIIDEFGDKSPADTWINISVALRKQGRFGRAEKMVKSGLKYSPNHLGLLNELAEIAHSRNDWPEAIKRWQYVLNSYSDKKRLAAVYVRLSYAYCKDGNYTAAQKIIDEGIQIHPNHVHVRAAYARVAMEAQDWPEAVLRWQKIIDEFGDEAFAGVWASLATTFLNQGKLDKATSATQEGLKKYPGDIELRVVFGEIANEQKSWDKAKNIWESLSEEVTNSSAVPNWLKFHIRLNNSVSKRIAKISEYRSQIKRYRTFKKRRKIAIYTSVTKSYDTLKLPEIINDNFDYIVYTDEPLDGMGVYQVRPLSQPKFSGDGSRATRYPKTHPHILLKNYDVAIWVDASMMIAGDLMPLVEDFINSGLPVGNATHPHRQSLSEEFEACIDLRKDDPAILKRQANYYKSIGFDTRDLANNGILFFNLKNRKLRQVMETWWDQICTYSKRDQLSFNYALFKNGAERYHLTKPPVDIRNHPVFIFSPHNSESVILEELYRLL
jgi:tetratricopeptide (TPR) repeat protein